MQISPAGLALIRAHEGFRAKAYYCPAGVLTIGYGHTNLDGSPPRVTPGLTITKAEAERVLTDTVNRVYGAAVTRLVKVPLNQNQFDALTSLVFNIGESNFAGSTLLRRLNRSDYDGAASAFAAWNRATVNGVKQALPGLTRRRAEEAALFRRGEIVPTRPVEEAEVVPDAEPMPQDVAPPKSPLQTASEIGAAASPFAAFLAYLTDWRVVAVLCAAALIGAGLWLWSRR